MLGIFKMKGWVMSSSKWTKTHLTVFEAGRVFGSSSACRLIEAKDEQSRIPISQGAMPTCSRCLRVMKDIGTLIK
jgi:hypothetical protein